MTEATRRASGRLYLQLMSRAGDRADAAPVEGEKKMFAMMFGAVATITISALIVVQRFQRW
ncbi:MAG: hypothetical protein HXY23_02230 [Parvularculaceae bacterium]|nr:hypothetical protein [Parvularculaceae bacterium]